LESNQNAERVRVLFRNETEDSTTTEVLNAVGESTTYSCESGETIEVAVIAETEDTSTVILEQTIDC